MTTSGIVRRVLVLVTTVGMVAANGLIATWPLFGRTTADVSALYPVLVTPAGYVFAIWGLIYLAMLTYATSQFLGPLRSSSLIDSLAAPIIVSNLMNVLWLVLWHGLLISLTVLVMLILLASLIVAYRRAHGRRSSARSALEGWTVRAPISLYLGWICVATIADVSAALYAGGWRGGPLPETAWAIMMLLAAGALALAGLALHRDYVFASVFVWALAGIAIAQKPAAVIWTAGSTASVIAAVAMFLVGRQLLGWRTRQQGAAEPTAT